MTPVVRALAISALAGAVWPGQGAAQGPELTGSWYGHGVEAHAGGPSQTWTIQITFLEGGRALIEYPSLNCGGALQRSSRFRQAPEWRESITHGDCVDGGRVRLRQENGALFMTWTGQGTDYPNANAAAVLYPSDLLS